MKISEEKIKQSAPTVKLKGWWWKKWFKKYRTQKAIMDMILKKHWIENFQEIQDEVFERLTKNKYFGFDVMESEALNDEEWLLADIDKEIYYEKNNSKI